MAGNVQTIAEDISKHNYYILCVKRERNVTKTDLSPGKPGMSAVSTILPTRSALPLIDVSNRSAHFNFTRREIAGKH